MFRPIFQCRLNFVAFALGFAHYRSGGDRRQRQADTVSTDERCIGVRLALVLGHDQLTGLFGEIQHLGLVVIVDHHEVAGLDLFGRDEVRQRIDQKTLDRPLEVPGTVFQIDTLAEQVFLGRVGTLKDEFRACRFGNAVLHGLKLDVEDLPQVMFLEAAKHDDLIDAVHKFG